MENQHNLPKGLSKFIKSIGGIPGIFFAIIIPIFGLYLAMQIYEKKNFISSLYKPIDLDYVFSFIGLVPTLLLVAAFLLNYLKGGTGIRDVANTTKELNAKLINRLEEVFSEKYFTLLIQKSVSENKGAIETENILNSIQLDSNDKEKIYDTITEVITTNINKTLLSSLEEKYLNNVANDLRYKDLLMSFTQSKERLEREVANLSLRGNVNLVIGALTTIVAVFVLYNSVSGSPYRLTDSVSILSYFLPRISTVIFIEIFSFFFLRLYRSSLNDIKYYQNEMTNFEFKIIALKSAFTIDDKEAIRQLVLDMSKTERNFLLQKDQTTMEIEMYKHQGKSDKLFVDNLKTLADILPKFRDKN